MNTGVTTTVAAVLAGLMGVGFSVLGRLAYHSARDLARIGERVARLEGAAEAAHHHREEP